MTQTDPSPGDNELRGRQAFWLVLAVALGMRLIYWLHLGEYPLLYVPLVDEEYYVGYARDLAGGHPAGERAPFLLDPLYAYFLAGLFALFGDNLVVPHLAQIVIDSVTALLLAALGTRWWSRRAGVLAGLAYALYPVAWFYSLTLLKTTLTAHVVTLLLWLLQRCLARPTGWLWLVSGAVLGAAVQLQSNLALLAPLLALWLWWRRPQLALVGRARYGLLLAGLVGVLVLGGLVSARVNGEFRVLGGHAGITLHGANHPGSPHGGNVSPPFVTVSHPAELPRQYRAEAERRVGHRLSPAEVQGYWVGQVLDYWSSAPTVLPKLMVHKLTHLVAAEEIPDNQSFYSAARFAPMLVPWLPAFGVLLALGLPGMVIGTRRHLDASLLWLPVAVVTLTAVVFFAVSRYRYPAVPALCLGAGCHLDFVAQRWRDIRDLLPVIGVTVLLFVLSVSAHGPPASPARDDLNVALALARLGEPERALAVLDRLEPELAGEATFHDTRAYATLLQGDFERTLGESRRALRADPRRVSALHNAGVAAYRLGRFDDAQGFFARACEVDADPEAEYWLGVVEQARGNTDGARDLLESLLKRPDLPAGLRERVRGVLPPGLQARP
jgi:4-amino-4-deoxy-L-arabinose transferase-like glycosyltransferase